MVFKTGIFRSAFCATGILSQTDLTDGYILQLHDNTAVNRFIVLYMCYNPSLYADIWLSAQTYGYVFCLSWVISRMGSNKVIWSQGRLKVIICQQMLVSWSFQNGVIVFFRFDQTSWNDVQYEALH